MTNYNSQSVDAVLARMEARQVEIRNDIVELKGDLDKMNKRMAELEAFRWKIAGIFTLVGGGAGAAVSKVLS